MNQGTAVQGLLSKDMQQFLENALGVYGKGLSGTEGVSNRGYDASGKLNDMLGSNLNQQGTLAFNNAQNKNQQHNDFINTLTKAFVTLGRGAMGGPLGAGIGNSIFGNKK
jgi:hypothetical protein